MSKVIGDNYSYGGAQPNFERDSFKTVSAMTAYANEGKLDKGHICYIIDEDKHYKWNGSDAVPFGGSSITLGSGLDDSEDVVSIKLATSQEMDSTPIHNAMGFIGKEVGVFVVSACRTSSTSLIRSPLNVANAGGEIEGMPPFFIFGLAEGLTTVAVSDDGMYGLSLLLEEKKGLGTSEYGLALKLSSVGGLEFDDQGVKIRTNSSALSLSTEYGLSLQCDQEGGIKTDSYGVRINLASLHKSASGQNIDGNPLELSNGLTIRIDHTLKVDPVTRALGVNELPSIDVTWTNGIGQLDTDDAGSPMVGLKMGERAGLIIDDEGAGSLHVQLPGEQLVDSAFNDDLGAWCGVYTQEDTILAGGGLIRGKNGLALYLDTNYFKSAEPSQYGGGPAPITLNIAAIAQAVASVINN